MANTSLGFIDDEGDVDSGQVENDIQKISRLLLALTERVVVLEKREPGQVPPPSSRRSVQASSFIHYEDEVKRIRDRSRDAYRERAINVFDLPANED